MPDLGAVYLYTLDICKRACSATRSDSQRALYVQQRNMVARYISFIRFPDKVRPRQSRMSSVAKSEEDFPLFIYVVDDICSGSFDGIITVGVM